jgi:hypothetical protein
MIFIGMFIDSDVSKGKSILNIFISTFPKTNRIKKEKAKAKAVAEISKLKKQVGGLTEEVKEYEKEISVLQTAVETFE